MLFSWLHTRSQKSKKPLVALIMCANRACEKSINELIGWSLIQSTECNSEKSMFSQPHRSQWLTPQLTDWTKWTRKCDGRKKTYHEAEPGFRKIVIYTAHDQLIYLWGEKINVSWVSRHKSLTRVVFSIREIVFCELYMDGRHLWRKVQWLLITGDHGLGAGAALVCCWDLKNELKVVEKMYTASVISCRKSLQHYWTW